MFELENFTYIKEVYPFEWVMLLLYVLVIMIYAFFRQSFRVKKDPLYRFFVPAVFVKLMSAVIFCLIYIYYYQGGDTVSYYESARAVVNLGLVHPQQMLTVLFSSPSMENYSLFTTQTGMPHLFMYNDPATWSVVKIIVPVLFVSFKSYILSSVVLSFLSFFGTWKLFLLLNRLYPVMEQRIALGVLFVPSVLFWGSGILKDTITFSSVCWFIVGFHGAFIGKEKRLRSILIFALAAYILALVKPYVLIALFPGSLIWLFHTRIVRIRSGFFRLVIIPFLFVAAFLVGYGFLDLFGDKLGKFSIEKMFKTASITQNDLKQDYYHGSSFDIGSFDPTLSGVMAKAPAAINVGLFRPFLWEARNAVMLVSGTENSFYLFLALVLMFRMTRKPGKFFSVLFSQPLLLFLLSYSLIFAVLVGLSTSNFGALVRFKIPFLSSFVVLLLVMEFVLKPKNEGYIEAVAELEKQKK